MKSATKKDIYIVENISLNMRNSPNLYKEVQKTNIRYVLYVSYISAYFEEYMALRHIISFLWRQNWQR